MVYKLPNDAAAHNSTFEQIDLMRGDHACRSLVHVSYYLVKCSLCTAWSAVLRLAAPLLWKLCCTQQHVLDLFNLPVLFFGKCSCNAGHCNAVDAHLSQPNGNAVEVMQGKSYSLLFLYINAHCKINGFNKCSTIVPISRQCSCTGIGRGAKIGKILAAGRGCLSQSCFFEHCKMLEI